MGKSSRAKTGAATSTKAKGGKNPHARSEAQIKARQMREERLKKEKRTRNIIIGVVAGLVLAIIATVAFIATRPKEDIDLGAYTGGQPITLSADGVGTVDESVPTLTEYFDYTCHHCANLDGQAGSRLSDAAEAGTINVKYQPVITVDMGFARPATTASLLVAKDDPTNWVPFHHALMDYFITAYNASDSSVIGSAAKSLDAIKDLAATAGVSQDVIDQFVEDGSDDYLQAATQTWKDADIEGRGDSLGTPEYVANDTTMIQLSAFDGDTVIAAVDEALGVTIP